MSGYASIHGSDSDNYIDTTGHGGRNDWIDAKDGNDTIHSGGGQDTVFAGSGKDLVYAGDGNDIIFGQAAQDTLYGQGGNDYIDGGNTEDEIYGGEGNDTLIGGQGRDYLDGGAGNDLLTGDGSGGSTQQDIFYFDDGFGHDTITDFRVGEDVLEITQEINGQAIHSAGDLLPYVSEAGGNAVITIGSDSITLVGVSRDDLIAGLDDAVNIV